MTITKNDIALFEQRYRATFINSLAGFRQAVLVGTKSKNEISNLAIFNSLIHLGANPALFGLISRPDSVPRDTLQNIEEIKEYTLNYVHHSHHEKAHQTAARYEKGVSEFEKVGFTELYTDQNKAPFVLEAHVKIGMQLEQILPIELNGTILIIGSVKSIEIADELIQKDGFVDLASAETLICQGLDAYFHSTLIARLPYAKP